MRTTTIGTKLLAGDDLWADSKDNHGSERVPPGSVGVVTVDGIDFGNGLISPCDVDYCIQTGRLISLAPAAAVPEPVGVQVGQRRRCDAMRATGTVLESLAGGRWAMRWLWDGGGVTEDLHWPTRDLLTLPIILDAPEQPKAVEPVPAKPVEPPKVPLCRWKLCIEPVSGYGSALCTYHGEHVGERPPPPPPAPRVLPYTVGNPWDSLYGLGSGTCCPVRRWWQR